MLCDIWVVEYDWTAEGKTFRKLTICESYGESEAVADQVRRDGFKLIAKWSLCQ